MTRYRYDPLADVVVPVTRPRPEKGLYIRRDLPPYRSPVTDEWVDGRAARRADLARTNCREVDPSERPAANARHRS